MSGFAALYYTDCRRGQGLLGGAGFQFQACSPDPPPEAAALIARAGLYEPPVPWMRRKRPVSDYPASLTHTVAGALHVTAAGRYLGLEVNGPREGNQFTHAIATLDPASYGLVRPAQLWDADLWRHEPAPTTRIEPVAVVRAATGWTTEAVRERAAATVDPQSWLAVLVTVLQARALGGGRPVLIVGEDPLDIAGRLAAATLLLPQATAVRIGFKIFTTDPQRGNHDVAAVHPDWADPWTADGTDSGFLVFDLVRGRYPATQPSEYAAFWVPRFLRGDPYDVVDAVEAASRFDTERGGAAPAEGRWAAAVTVLGERLPDLAAARAVAAQLAAAPPETSSVVDPALCAALLEAAPSDAAMLRDLVQAAALHGVADVDRIRAGLLRAEIATVLGGGEARDPADLPPLLPVAETAEGRAQRRALVEAALAAAVPAEFPALLALATRHGLIPREQTFEAAAAAFADWWLDHPAEVDHDPRWTLAAEALHWLHAALHRRLTGARARAAEPLVRHTWWPVLWPLAVDPTDPLDAMLCACAYAAAPESGRDEVLRRVLRLARDATDVGAVVWSAVSRHLPEPRSVELGRVLRALRDAGQPYSGRLAAEGFEVLATEQPSGAGLTVLGLLERAGHGAPSWLSGWHDHDRYLSGTIEGFRGAAPRDAPALAARLALVDPGILEARRATLVRGLVGAPADAAITVLEHLSPPLRVQVLDAVLALFPEPGVAPSADGRRALAVVFRLVHAPPRALVADARRLAPDLAEAARHLGRHDRGLVDHADREDTLGAPWWDWLREVDRTARRERFRRSLGAGEGPAGLLSRLAGRRPRG